MGALEFHLVGHMIRMRSRCEASLNTLLTTVPSTFHHQQGPGWTVALQRNVTVVLRSIICDATSFTGMTKSCFFYLVNTFD